MLDCVNVSCRILGFRRAPLVVGRYVNLRTEIKPVATEQLLSTFLMQGQYLFSVSSCLSKNCQARKLRTTSCLGKVWLCNLSIKVQ